jgi:hypothetical protein
MTPSFDPLVPGMLFLPALFQVRDLLTSSDQVPIDADAREFMIAYAEDLRHGRRQSIGSLTPKIFDMAGDSRSSRDTTGEAHIALAKERRISNHGS